MTDDIDAKLIEQQRRREMLRQQLSETSSVLSDVENQIDALKDPGEAHREAADQAEQVATQTSRDPAQAEQLQTRRRISDENLKIRLVPEWLTDEQVKVKPGERITDRPFLFSETIEHSAAAVCLKTAAGRFLYANRTVHKFFAAHFGSMIGTLDADWSTAELAAKYTANDQKVIESKETLDAMELAVQTDGTTSYFYSHRFPVFCKNETLVAIVAFDVTDLVTSFGVDRALEMARVRFERMEMLKQQLMRLAQQLGEKRNA